MLTWENVEILMMTPVLHCNRSMATMEVLFYIVKLKGSIVLLLEGDISSTVQYQFWPDVAMHTSIFLTQPKRRLLFWKFYPYTEKTTKFLSWATLVNMVWSAWCLITYICPPPLPKPCVCISFDVSDSSNT